MLDDASAVLDECLNLLEKGEATIEQCLARFPAHAAELRPLLEAARAVRHMPRPTASPSAFSSGKARMLEALAAKGRPAAARPSLAERLYTALLGREAPTRPRLAAALRLALVVAAALLLIALGVLVSVPWGPGVAHAAALTQASGIVEVLPAGQTAWRAVFTGDTISEGVCIRTGPGSTATLTFFDGSTSALQEGTEVTVKEVQPQPDGGRAIVLHQDRGQTLHRVRHCPGPVSRFEIETPWAVAAVCETEFVVAVKADGGTAVAVIDGVVQVSAQDVVVSVAAGQATMVQPEHPPVTAYPAPTATAARAPTAMPTAEWTVAPEPTEQRETTQPTERPETPRPTEDPGIPETPKPTYTPEPTEHRETPHPTETLRPTPTPEPTETPKPTPTREPTETPKATPTPQ